MAIHCTGQELQQFAAAASTEAGEADLDDQTWRDLEIGRYFGILSSEVSVFGQQILNQRLRRGATARADDFNSDVANIESLMADEVFVASLHDAFLKLRKVETEVSGLLFCEKIPKVPSWTRYLWMVPIVLFSSLIGLRLSLWSLLPLMSAIIVSGVMQVLLFGAMSAWQRQRRSILTLLEVAVFLQTLAINCKNPALRACVSDLPDAANILKSLRPRKYNSLNAMSEYTNLLALSEYREFSRQVGRLEHQVALLRRIFVGVGTLEAYLAVAENLRRADVYCRAEFNDRREIEFRDVVNPLMNRPCPIGVVGIRNGGAFVSGKNGAGKSTLLRTVGLNLVFANAFGYCYAVSADVPMRPVISSIKIEDSLERGDSLYVAELKRAQQLLVLSGRPGGAVILIDEIFRGTNHLESVSASAAVLHQLTLNSMVLVSSHNLILAPLLRERLDPLCVKRLDSDPSLIDLQPGILAETNGIALMGAYGIDRSIVAEATSVFRWLESYLTHPASCPSMGTISSGDSS